MGAGSPDEQVDGNGVLAVIKHIRVVPGCAYQDKGPTLLECIDYRLRDHITTDDVSHYYFAEEVSQVWREGPIKRLYAFPVGRSQ